MKYCREYLYNKLLRAMDKFAFKSPVLEVGCGTGWLLEALSRRYDIEGIDASEEAVSRCRAKGLNVRKKDFLEIRDKFNSIICIDVLEHIEDDAGFIRHLYDCLLPEGKIFLMVPSGRIMRDDILFGHYRRYTRGAIRALAAGSGFTIKKVEMLGYPVSYYARIALNLMHPPEASREETLQERILRSSFEHPFDRSIYCRALRNPLVSKIVSGALSVQNVFSGGDKGFAVSMVASKEQYE